MNLPIDIPGPQDHRPGRSRVDTPRPQPFVVPKFLTQPDPSENEDLHDDLDEPAGSADDAARDAMIDLRPDDAGPQQPLWSQPAAQPAPHKFDPSFLDPETRDQRQGEPPQFERRPSESMPSDSMPSESRASEPASSEVADGILRGLLAKTKMEAASHSPPRPADAASSESTLEPVLAVPRPRVDLIAPEDLPERLRVQAAKDPLDALLGERFATKRFGPANLILSTTINPPAGGGERYFGPNPTDLDLDWDDVEPMVLRTWEEASPHEYFAGSVVESWLEVGEHWVLIHFEIGDELTVWKFTNFFRAAVEDASRTI